MSTADEVLLPGPVPRWEVPGWRSRFGLVAGITGRGNPAEPFNLGLWGSQPTGLVMTRWRALLGDLPGYRSAILAHQVHGTKVLWHDAASRGWTLLEGADGHATDSAGRYLLVTVADCVPVYLAAPAQGVFALLHAGWRGTVGGIVPAALRLLRKVRNIVPSDVVMHCGVAISGDRYEVGNEVLLAAGQARPDGGPGPLDLRELLQQQALAAGVAEVSVSGLCSADPAGAFFSHRGSGGRDGRMVAYLGRAAAS